MTIEGASRKCVEKLYTIFRIGEIEVTPVEDDLYDVIIPSSFNLSTFHYGKHNSITMVLYRGDMLDNPYREEFSTDEFVRLSIS